MIKCKVESLRRHNSSVINRVSTAVCQKKHKVQKVKIVIAWFGVGQMCFGLVKGAKQFFKTS